MSSILDLYGKRKPNRRKEPLMADENMAVPSFINTPGAIARPPRASARSERAAEAAQQWEELENELRDAKARYEIEVTQLKTEIYELKGRLATVEKANEILNVDCETLRVRGEANQDKLNSQRAKLSVATKIILDLNREELPNLTEDHSEEAHQAVEEALK